MDVKYLDQCHSLLPAFSVDTLGVFKCQIVKMSDSKRSVNIFIIKVEVE